MYTYSYAIFDDAAREPFEEWRGAVKGGPLRLVVFSRVWGLAVWVLLVVLGFWGLAFRD